jgi:ketosteroid isomerase-like protein
VKFCKSLVFPRTAMKTMCRPVMTILFLLATTLCGFAEDEAARIAGLNGYWAKVSKAVKDGDFASYVSTCHAEAVLVSGTKKQSYPLTQALARWKKEFDDTKAGTRESAVEFRFSQRLGDATTAHETSVFRYSFRQDGAEWQHEYVHLEALLKKDAEGWKILMEYQKSVATEAEWNALK